MASVDDVARVITGAVDYDDAVARCQNANLSVQSSVGCIEVAGGTIAVAQVVGNHRNAGYWIVYNIANPQYKAKVEAGAPRERQLGKPQPPPD